MIKNKNIITLFILTVLSIGVLILSIVNLTVEKNKNKRINIDVTKENQIIKLIDFEINPGEEIIYQVKLGNSKTNMFEVEIWFDSVDQSLKNILNVYTKYDTYQTTKFNINSINQENKIKFNYIKNLKYNTFDLIFYMDEDIGNEAQNLKFDFKTYINVKE